MTSHHKRKKSYHLINYLTICCFKEITCMYGKTAVKKYVENNNGNKYSYQPIMLVQYCQHICGRHGHAQDFSKIQFLDPHILLVCKCTLYFSHMFVLCQTDFIYPYKLHKSKMPFRQ